jgi:hypothetical protein
MADLEIEDLQIGFVSNVLTEKVGTVTFGLMTRGRRTLGRKIQEV